MHLGTFVASLPHGERQRFRVELAKAHGKSVALIRKWENDPPPADWDAEKVRRMSRRHPSDLHSIQITERATGHQVSRQDLRPEVWPVEVAAG